MPDNKQTKKPKPGGLFANNKTAFIDSTLNANRSKEWVQRLYKKNTPKMTLPGEDRPSTHLMGDDGNGYVFPTLVVKPGDTKLTNMGRDAEGYARDTNTGIQFPSKAKGDYFASHNNGNGSFGGYKKGTGVLPEFKMGRKNIKVKKAVNGLQDVAVPQQGSYSNVLSSTSSLAAAGSQFGLIGAGIGAVGGLGLGLLQKSQQDKAAKAALAVNNDRRINRAYAAADESVNQASQRFSKGTKMIEIEGKKTPEIHTDKNFKVKNLGSIPHSKGGNKVEASEGDIVFNTQNSLTKFNKIASAISAGDTKTLKQERDKLPKDKGTKNQTGNRGVRKSKAAGDYLTDEERKEIPKASNARVNALVDSVTNRIGRTSGKMTKPLSLASSGQDIRGGRGRGEIDTPTFPVRNSLSSNSKRPTGSPYTTYAKAFQSIPTIFNDSKNYVKTPDFSLGKYGIGANNTSPINPIVNKKITAPVGTPKIGKQVYKPVKVPTSNLPSLDSIRPDIDNFSNIGDGSDLRQTTEKPLMSLEGNSKPSVSISQSSSSTDSTKSNGANTGLNNALQFAGVANNIFQGLKGEESIDQRYYNPTKLKYTDRSQSLRNQSNQAMNSSISSARNLSGGGAGNFRSNANAARLANLSTQGGIDEREQARADAIANQNVEISNQASQINLGRKDNYQNMMMQNRAAKQSYLDQAASDIGQYGMAKREEGYMRSRDDKAMAAQMAGYNSINGRYQHKSNLDGSTYFDADADSSITKYGTGGGNRVVTKKKTLGIFKKGTKAIKTRSII